MVDRWFCSDHHFGHENILTFKDYDNKPVRTFDNVVQMNEHMVERHNAVVKPNDKVYFGGDVVIPRSALFWIGKLNGRKELIKGNHDIYKLSDYTPYFEDFHGVKVFSGDFVFSHVPLHVESLFRWNRNVHGHLHTNVVKGKWGKPDPRYLSVCMEQLDNYTPMNYDDILKTFEWRENEI